MITCIKKLFFNLSQNTLAFQSLKEKLSSTTTFIEMIRSLEDFVKNQKIMVPKKINDFMRN